MIPWRKRGVVLGKIPRGVPEEIAGAILGEIFGVLPGENPELSGTFG